MRTYHLVILHGAAFLALPMAVMTAAFSSGCSADIHDNVINIPNATINATVNADVDVNNVMPDQTVPVMFDVQNVFLCPKDVTPPPEHTEDAGHIQVYMDSTSNPPIMVTAEVMVNVVIPHETKAGKHKLICRVHKHDGRPTSTQKEIEIDVKTSVTIGGDGGTSTGTGGAMGTGGASGTGGAPGTGGANGTGGAPGAVDAGAAG